MSNHTFCEEFLATVQLKPPLAQLKTIPLIQGACASVGRVLVGLLTKIRLRVTVGQWGYSEQESSYWAALAVYMCDDGLYQKCEWGCSFESLYVQVAITGETQFLGDRDREQLLDKVLLLEDSTLYLYSHLQTSILLSYCREQDEAGGAVWCE
ncbi:hypothetical protein BTVI_103300 [Pitangus sulphuratus]|nr:hypothetical protein BTVI_103300 [Pitangus sulphuratus]